MSIDHLMWRLKSHSRPVKRAEHLIHHIKRGVTQRGCRRRRGRRRRKPWKSRCLGTR
jgi:hypothetical protein